MWKPKCNKNIQSDQWLYERADSTHRLGRIFSEIKSVPDRNHSFYKGLNPEMWRFLFNKTFLMEDFMWVESQ